MKIKKNKHLLLIFTLISVTFLITVLYLGIHNYKLKKKINQKQFPSYIFKADDLAKKAQEEMNEQVLIVKNDKIGLWDKDKSNDKKLKLIDDLIIGNEEEDDNKIFYRIGGIISDKNGSIYICETYDGRIKKFDYKGNYLFTIGKKGQGTGDLLFPGNMAFDNNGNLCVLEFGNRRISKFTREGIYITSIKIDLKKAPSGFVIDNEDNYFISMWDRETDEVIHKFNSIGELFYSVGNSVYFFDTNTPINKIIKGNISTGSIALYKTDLYFSRFNPYEIQKYSQNGFLKMLIFRENDFMPPANYQIKGKGSLSFKLPAGSFYIGIWKNKIINQVKSPKRLSSGYKTVIDFFNLEGQLLTTLKYKDEIDLYYIDNQDKLYAKIIDDNGIEKVCRFKIIEEK